MNEYLKKGDKVGIAGRLVTRSYEDTGGQKKYFTEVVAKDLLLLSKKPSDA
jgi:single-strand DNA-binding protein